MNAVSLDQSDGVQEVTLTDLREELGKRISLAEYARQITLVTRYGNRVAAIVPVDVVDAWLATRLPERGQVIDTDEALSRVKAAGGSNVRPQDVVDAVRAARGVGSEQ
jgi:hypothetical protein